MFKYLFSIIVYLALAVLIGSVVFFGAGVASLLFQPDFLPSRTMAGMINSAILGRLGRIEIVAEVLLVGGTLFMAARYRHWLNWGALIIAVGMLATTAYTSARLYPRMDDLRVAIGDFDHMPTEKAELKAEFDRGHRLYSNLEKGVLLGAVLVLILHTTALVRRTELHARRYALLEGEVRRLRGEGRTPPRATAAQEKKAGESVEPEVLPNGAARETVAKKAVATE